MTPSPRNYPDAEIDSVLRALGTVEAAPDLSERLLAQLARQAKSPVGTGRAWWQSLMPIQPATALAATALLIASLLAFRLFLPRALPVPHRKAKITSSPQSPSPLASSQLTPRQSPQRASLSEANGSSPSGTQSRITQGHLQAANQPAPQADTPRLFLQLVASARASREDLPATQAALDAQALDDLHAPSQPAPRESTTGQERLVRLMLRQGERHDLAQLEPAERAAFSQQQTREFNTFFNPPRPPLVTALANRVHAPKAISLTEVREIEAGQRTAAQPSTPAPSALMTSGDLK